MSEQTTEEKVAALESKVAELEARIVNVFIIDKRITTGSNSDEQLVTAAQAAGQAEIDEWAASFANVGKTWNPETNSFE